MDFSLLLVIAVALSGVIYLLDVLLFKPRRRQRVATALAKAQDAEARLNAHLGLERDADRFHMFEGKKRPQNDQHRDWTYKILLNFGIPVDFNNIGSWEQEICYPSTGCSSCGKGSRSSAYESTAETSYAGNSPSCEVRTGEGRRVS